MGSKAWTALDYVVWFVMTSTIIICVTFAIFILHDINKKRRARKKELKDWAASFAPKCVKDF